MMDENKQHDELTKKIMTDTPNHVGEFKAGKLPPTTPNCRDIVERLRDHWNKYGGRGPNDASFIGETMWREAVRAALAADDATNEMANDLLTQLGLIEWVPVGSADPDYPCCPQCGNAKPDHTWDCRLAKLLNKYERGPLAADDRREMATDPAISALEVATAYRDGLTTAVAIIDEVLGYVRINADAGDEMERLKAAVAKLRNILAAQEANHAQG